MAMLKLENGNTAAHQLAEHFREVYRRRPSFMVKSVSSDWLCK